MIVPIDARRTILNARTTEIASSHVAFLSHPREVAKLIEEAATAAPVGARG
jgi:hypothetical protein